MIRFLDLKAVNSLPGLHLGDTVKRVAEGGRYLKGDYTRRFEQAYAEYIGTRFCVGCGNGLDALTLILRAYIELGRLKPGDEVVVPANTYIATILSITENGLVPVLVEPDVRTLQIDDRLIEPVLTPRTRAVMIVHLYGRCAYTEEIGRICTEHNLLLIEDNAQAHGCKAPSNLPPPGEASANRASIGELTSKDSPGEGRLEGALLPIAKRTGSLGHAAAHSFYPTKNLGALGDAGAVTTDDETLAQLVATLGNYGSDRRYHFAHLGVNSRMDELQAAVLLEKLPLLDQWNDRRKAIARRYEHSLANHPDIQLVCPDRDSVYHLFPILTPRRDDLQQYLLQQGIETDIHYPIPPHQQPCYKSLPRLSLPVTERIHREILSLPCNPAMTDEQVGYVCDRLEKQFTISN